MDKLKIYIILSLLFLTSYDSYAIAATVTTEIEQANFRKNEEKKRDLQLKFKDPSWSSRLLRHMGYTPAGGADIGECLQIAEQIREGDFQSWQTEWAKAANRLLSYASKAMLNNHTETAKEGLFRSCNYFLASMSFLPRGPEKLALLEQAKNCFIKASSLTQSSLQPIQIAYENTYLPGYFCPAHSSGKPSKTVILNTGYDGTAEELYFSVGFFAQKRGYNVLIFEGPGQGLPLLKDDLPFRPDWEKVIRAVVDFALSRKEVDPHRLALYGRSFGGNLAPRAAAFEHRITALIVNSPINSFLDVMEHNGLPVKLAKKNPQEFNQKILSETENSPKLKLTVDEGMWKIGGSTPSEWVSNLEKYTLEDKPALIKCPTLVIDSEEDSMVDRDQAKIFYDRLTCPKKMEVFTKETGAATHCQMGACYYANEVIFDWLDETFFQSTSYFLN